LNIVSIIVIAAITTAAIAIQFAHRTSLRLTSESHLLRARCRLSLLALRNINVTRSIHTYYTARSEGMGRGISHKICAGITLRAEGKILAPAPPLSQIQRERASKQTTRAMLISFRLFVCLFVIQSARFTMKRPAKVLGTPRLA
jgi:hypothetical protein